MGLRAVFGAVRCPELPGSDQCARSLLSVSCSRSLCKLYPVSAALSAAFAEAICSCMPRRLPEAWRLHVVPLPQADDPGSAAREESVETKIYV